jgi:hypothetical protein
MAFCSWRARPLNGPTKSNNHGCSWRAQATPWALYQTGPSCELLNFSNIFGGFKTSQIAQRGTQTAANSTRCRQRLQLSRLK